MGITNFVRQILFSENYHYCEVLCLSLFLKELFELIKLILWHSNNQTYHLDSWKILRFLGVAFQSFVVLVSHLVRWRVKTQQILSTRSWGFKPSLLSGFITIVGGVHIIFFFNWWTSINRFDLANSSIGRSNLELWKWLKCPWCIFRSNSSVLN
jgi:hypothetical protein